MSGIASGLLGLGYFDDEDDEWETATGAVCRKLEAQGISVNGELVRRAIRELGVETRKQNGRLEIRSDDVLGLVDFLKGKVQRSGTRQPVSTVRS